MTCRWSLKANWKDLQSSVWAPWEKGLALLQKYSKGLTIEPIWAYIYILYIYYIYIIHIYIYVQYMIHVLVPRPRTQNPGQLSTQKLPGRSTFSQWDWCPLPSFRGDLGSEHELKNCQLRTILLVRAKRRAAGWVMDGLLGWWHYEWWWNGSFPNIPCVKRSSKMKHRREHVM